MELSNDLMKEYSKRLLLSRLRLLTENGFYGILLMHAKFAIDSNAETAYTDGEKIVFGTRFLEELTDSELDFVLMHEVLHIALKHCFRTNGRDEFLFNVACDIVVNSNILRSQNMDKRKITLTNYGEAMHTVPDGSEGYLYTAEEVYELIKKEFEKNAKKGVSGKNSSSKSNGSTSKNGQNNNGRNGQGKNSNGGNSGMKSNGYGYPDCGVSGARIDSHSQWGKTPDNDELERFWEMRLRQAVESISVRESSTNRGLVPLCAKRVLDQLKNPIIDWRTILQNFVQEEVMDYSFSPPDRRFDNGFYLPDFNEKDESVENILFMIDTSGSMSDDDVARCYSEIKGAIDQFNGKLKGYLGFFDAEVVKPVPFMDEEEFKRINAYGGGGTDFGVIFKYIEKEMADNLPKSVVILTDGYAPFPDKNKIIDIPVLWVINNLEIDPPYGVVARMVDKNAN